MVPPAGISRLESASGRNSKKRMCWRGHPERYQYRDKRGHLVCRTCHAIVVRDWRRGQRSDRQPRFILSVDNLPTGLWAKLRIELELSGLSKDTISCWIHGSRHDNRCGTSTTYERALAFAGVLDVPFEKLWTIREIV